MIVHPDITNTPTTAHPDITSTLTTVHPDITSTLMTAHPGTTISWVTLSLSSILPMTTLLPTMRFTVSLQSLCCSFTCNTITICPSTVHILPATPPPHDPQFTFHLQHHQHMSLNSSYFTCNTTTTCPSIVHISPATHQPPHTFCLKHQSHKFMFCCVLTAAKWIFRCGQSSCVVLCCVVHVLYCTTAQKNSPL